jgi:AbiV family abortive infection protein
MKTMSVEQLVEGRTMPLKNAADLICDAEILFGNGRWPRCVFLSSIAIEELGKYLMIMGAIGGVLTRSIDWKTFSKRFRSHKEKTGNIMVLDAFLEHFVSLEATLANLCRSQKHTNDQENEKLSALYVDLSQDGFVAPTQHVDQAMARSALDSAKAVYRFFDQMESRVFSTMSLDELTPEMFLHAERLLIGSSDP